MPSVSATARRCLVLAGTVSVLVAATGPSAAADGCDHIWDDLNPVCVAQKAAQHAATGVAGIIIDGVIYLAGAVGDSLQAAGTPDLNQSWFQTTYATTRQIGAMCALIALLCALTYAMLMRDGRELGRSLTQVLAAGLSTGLIGALVMIANGFADYLCDYALGKAGWHAIVSGDGGLKPIGVALSKAMTKSSVTGTDVGTPVILVIIIGLIMIFAFLVIWCEMVIRRLAIDLCVTFWPLAAAGSVWPQARQWQRRLVDTLLTVMIAKPVIVIVLKEAANALGDANKHPTPTKLIIASGLYLMAAFAPWVVMRMIGFIGGAAQPGHTGEGLRSAAAGAAVGGLTALASRAAGLGGAHSRTGPSKPQSKPAPADDDNQEEDTGRPKKADEDARPAITPSTRQMISAGRNAGGIPAALPAGDGGGAGGGRRAISAPARLALEAGAPADPDPGGPGQAPPSPPPRPPAPVPGGTGESGGARYAGPAASHAPAPGSAPPPPRRPEPNPPSGGTT